MVFVWCDNTTLFGINNHAIFFVEDILLCLKYSDKTDYASTQSDTTIQHLLLYYYWLLVLVSMDHHQSNIYKKLKNAGACSM